MATKKKLLQAAAGNAGGAGLDIDEVFSTYLYTGTGSTLNIVNGIDLAGEGGLVWHKYRGGTSDHGLFDTERGVSRKLGSNNTDAQTAAFSGYGITAFNSNGYTLGTQYSGENGNGNEVVSWTFRKAPKFFDVVTYTGTGSVQNIAHNLDSVPNCIFVKCTSNGGITNEWAVYHTSLGNGYYLYLNANSSQQTGASTWNNTTPTSTQFTVGTSTRVNTSGRTYVAYIFAHNDGDGDFGPDSDQDIIKCGSYTGNGSTDGPDIDLGFEPQWVMLKNSSTGNSFTTWNMYDNMRGVATGGNDARLFANSSEQEYSNLDTLRFNANGFSVEGSTSGQVNASGDNYVYIAIRRGPMAVPESATEVFAIDSASGTAPTPPLFTAGFPVDMYLFKTADTNSNWRLFDRMRGDEVYLKPNNTEADDVTGDDAGQHNDLMTGIGTATYTNADQYQWMWRRAPNFCDVVAYTGNGTAGRTVSHNLGVAPEMVWYKNRGDTINWIVYHKDIGTDPTTEVLELDTSDAKRTSTAFFNSTAPSASVLTLGTAGHTNYNNNTYIAYLFASLAGISKVGSVTHSGTTNVDCGFSSGARFVLLKRTDASGDWYVWDSTRGIVSGNDPYLLLNTTAAQVTNTDYIDPLSSGFTITSSFTAGTYIFYAIA